MLLFRFDWARKLTIFRCRNNRILPPYFQGDWRTINRNRENNRRWDDFDLMLGQHRRQWPRIKPNPAEHLALASWYNGRGCDPISQSSFCSGILYDNFRHSAWAAYISGSGIWHALFTWRASIRTKHRCELRGVEGQWKRQTSSKPSGVESLLV